MDGFSNLHGEHTNAIQYHDRSWTITMMASLMTGRHLRAAGSVCGGNIKCTPFGNFNIIPAAGAMPIPINYGNGPSRWDADIRSRRTWGWGEKRNVAAATGGGAGGAGGGGGPGGGGGGASVVAELAAAGVVGVAAEGVASAAVEADAAAAWAQSAVVRQSSL